MLAHQKAAFSSAKKAIRLRAVDLSQSKGIEDADEISTTPKNPLTAATDVGDRTVDGSVGDMSRRWEEPGVGGNIENESYHGGADESAKPLIQGKQIGGAERAAREKQDLDEKGGSVRDIGSDDDTETEVTEAEDFQKHGDGADITNARSAGVGRRNLKAWKPDSPIEDSSEESDSEDPEKERHQSPGKFHPVGKIGKFKKG